MSSFSRLPLSHKPQSLNISVSPQLRFFFSFLFDSILQREMASGIFHVATISLSLLMSRLITTLPSWPRLLPASGEVLRRRQVKETTQKWTPRSTFFSPPDSFSSWDVLEG